MRTPILDSEVQMRHARTRKSRIHWVEFALAIILAIIIAGVIGFLFKPPPFVSEVGTVDNTASYRACAGIYSYPFGPYGPKVFVGPWHPPYKCVTV